MCVCVCVTVCFEKHFANIYVQRIENVASFFKSLLFEIERSVQMYFVWFLHPYFAESSKAENTTFS